MTLSSTPPVTHPGGRIASIDTLRGITILVMLFVNDLAGVIDVPAWMKHAGRFADTMTFVDVVFPAFLFLVGMSIPLSIGRKLDKGDALWPIWQHILVRTTGLLIIGVLMVNSEITSERGVLNPDLWTLLMYVGVIMVWNKPPSDRGKTGYRTIVLRWLGVLILAVLVILYRGEGISGVIQIRPHWWGILGLIGWAYITACIIYIPMQKNMAGLIGATILLYCLYLVDQTGGLPLSQWLGGWITVSYTLGSHTAIIVSGVILGCIVGPDSAASSHGQRIRRALLYALCLATAGFLLHTLHNLNNAFIISKLLGTPPWCLLSSAVTVVIWTAVYWVMDVRRFTRWAVIVQPAGANALFAYILAPMLYAALSLIASAIGGYNFYTALGNHFWLGLIRATLHAFGLTWLTSGLKKLGISLKL